MFDASTGWAVTADRKRLLRTTQGAANWQDVTPAFGSSTYIDGSPDFLNAETAWLAVDCNNEQLCVYRTHDGGASWQQAQISEEHGIVSGAGQIVFSNTQDGWLLVGKGAAAGSEAVDVLHTVDGGATWKLISAARYTIQGNQPGTIPFGGDKTGISFVNPNTGWITGFSPAPFTWLYVTHDSGVTWQHQDIALPASAFGTTVFPPVFFNATDGILPTDIAEPQSQSTNIYVTHDGGATWHPTGAIPVSLTSTNITFVDATHGWIVDNLEDISNTYINSTLYSTSDGGQHWMQRTIKLGSDITMLDFASSTQGWALNSTNALYATMNGGQTWTKVAPTIV